MTALLPSTIEEAGPTAPARIVSGALALAAAGLAAAAQGQPWTGAIAGFAAAMVVALAAIDLRRRIIPNRIVLPATLLVLAARAAQSPAHVAQFVVASALAGLALLILNLVTRSGIGMGDVKFALLIGATLGSRAFGAITLGFLAIFPVALFVLIRGGLSARKASLPMAPFLALGTLIMLIVPGTLG